MDVPASGSIPPPPPESGATTGGRRSRWMAHVKKTMRANKGKSLAQVLKMAKKTYKKTRRGGGDGDGGEDEVLTGGYSLAPLPLNGGRRRRGSRKSKKGSRKH